MYVLILLALLVVKQVAMKINCVLKQMFMFLLFVIPTAYDR